MKSLQKIFAGLSQHPDNVGDILLSSGTTLKAMRIKDAGEDFIYVATTARGSEHYTIPINNIVSFTHAWSTDQTAYHDGNYTQIADPLNVFGDVDNASGGTSALDKMANKAGIF